MSHASAADSSFAKLPRSSCPVCAHQQYPLRDTHSIPFLKLKPEVLAVLTSKVALKGMPTSACHLLF